MSRLQDENDDKVAENEEKSEEGSEGNTPVTEHSEMDHRTCQICNKMFYTRGNMKAHVKYHHEMKGRLACQSCDKSYSSKAGLHIILEEIIQMGMKLNVKSVMRGFRILRIMLPIEGRTSHPLFNFCKSARNVTRSSVESGISINTKKTYMELNPNSTQIK